MADNQDTLFQILSSQDNILYYDDKTHTVQKT